MLFDLRGDLGTVKRHGFDDRSLCAVVGHEDDDGVVEFPGLGQVVEHPADVPVHPVHHAGVDLHAAG